MSNSLETMDDIVNGSIYAAPCLKNSNPIHFNIDKDEKENIVDMETTYTAMATFSCQDIEGLGEHTRQEFIQHILPSLHAYKTPLNLVGFPNY